MLIHVLSAVLVLTATSLIAKPNSEAGFMKALRHDLDNLELRLQFADWLKKDGQKARAKFLRLAVQAARSPHREAESIGEDMIELLDKHHRDIAPGLPNHYYAKHWYNDRIDYWSVTGLPIVEHIADDRLADDLEALFGKDESCLVGLGLQFEHGTSLRFKQILKSKHMKRVAHLEIYSTQFDGAKHLLESKHLESLRHLIFLSPSGIFNRGVADFIARKIPQTPALSGLTHLRLPLWSDQRSRFFKNLRKTYLDSSVLGNVVETPLIYPGSEPSSIVTRRPDQPYIGQKEWDNRSGRGDSCARRVASR